MAEWTPGRKVIAGGTTANLRRNIVKRIAEILEMKHMKKVVIQYL